MGDSERSLHAHGAPPAAPFIRPERLKRRPALPILRWMRIVERLMPELAGAGPRTRAAVTVSAAATASSDRRVWIALTGAAGMWMAGTVWESTIGHADGAAIGPADGLWLSFYPLAYLAVVLRGRTTMRLGRTLRVDGL